jgi:hypothetical protein
MAQAAAWISRNHQPTVTAALGRCVGCARATMGAWFMHDGSFDLAAPPPEGVFHNRMSASSHTRDHGLSAELTACVLAWLTRWGRIVVNGPAALDLEISKVRQYAALEASGLRTPRTVMVAGRDRIVAAAQTHFDGDPVILAPRRWNLSSVHIAVRGAEQGQGSRDDRELNLQLSRLRSRLSARFG